MFSNTITLKKQDGTDVDFVLTRFVESGNGGSERLASSSTLVDPTFMRISHRVVNSGKGTAKQTVDQHLIQMDDNLVDATSGRSVRSVVNLTINAPRDSIFSKTALYDQLRQIVQFITGSSTVTISTTAVDQLLRGEV